MTRTVYIVDDDDAVRASLHSLLSVRSDLIIRSYRSGDAFLEEAGDLDPGVLLLDFHMPGATGLDVLEAIQEREFAAIILTGQGNVSLAVQAMKAGALDFMEKPYEAEQLMAVLERAFATLEESSETTARLDAAKGKISKLSPRETDVLKGLIEGRSNKVIAYELDISPRTVEIYRANLMEKLEVRSLSEALRIAFAAGLFKA
ncbi:response regulator [Sphingomonas sp. G-3-2-10]|jgi:two-component system response regulator FixJ|uniref:response regulator transcription factor n=1 Tax=Sphingomonas sp. G-3-2-10 TaxID=2728838 RepID=UPI00146F5067|nr:response regulator [Sphingomonas sp. G-3-2-10]NML05671.1 response regulator [Sphingomonas sp. G-3-2-10]